MAIRYAVTLHKGGVGKTTTSVNLTGVLAEQGKRVLVIDCDSQGDLSSIFLQGHDQLPFTIADIFADTGVLTEDLIQPTAINGVSIIPADRRLEQFERTHEFKNDVLIHCLDEAIREVEDQFDYVVLDTATRPHLTGYAALVACDVALIPLEASKFSFRSVASIRNYVELESDARSLNPAMKIRYFMSKAKKSKAHEAVRDGLAEVLGSEAFLQTSIPDSASINTAISLNLPICLKSKNVAASKAYRQLVAELQESTHEQYIVHAHTSAA